MMCVGLATSSVYPLSVEHGFRMAAKVGYDGVEVMVTRDERTQNTASLQELSEQYAMPVLSIHAPVLLLTHFVWGVDPKVKLERSAELAASLGATTVVVHPPFRWQSGYAENFLDIVRATAKASGVEIAVENMFPWRAAGRSVRAYSPGWDPSGFDCDAVTLDFSHASLSGQSALELAQALGSRLRHVHLCDGTASGGEGRVFDEHALPGRGTQPVAQVLNMLTANGWQGSVVAEVNTRKARSESERLAMLSETLNFARRHTEGSV